MDDKFYTQIQEYLSRMMVSDDLTEVSLMYSFVSTRLAQMFDDKVFSINCKSNDEYACSGQTFSP